MLAAGVPAYEDPATTRLLHEAAVGDTIGIADATRLFRSVADVLALRPVLIRRGLHLRVESGLLSGMDLASDPGTKMMVSVLAVVLEFQRDMISENTREGVAAAEAAGKTLGRPAAPPPSTRARRPPSWLPTPGRRRQGPGPAAPRRPQDHPPRSRRRRRPLPVWPARHAPDPPRRAGRCARLISGRGPRRARTTRRSLRIAGDEVVRLALVAGLDIRRSPGYSVRIVAPLALHRATLEQSAAATNSAGPAERKAHRVYAARVAAVEAAQPHRP
ncbi:hypothetical protein GBF35_23945 [Nonomuraea phyllanthi]|nr:hypothetical protein GBF35_23945 [Nonomuraea phyllanthi]